VVVALLRGGCSVAFDFDQDMHAFMLNGRHVIGSGNVHRSAHQGRSNEQPFTQVVGRTTDHHLTHVVGARLTIERSQVQILSLQCGQSPHNCILIPGEGVNLTCIVVPGGGTPKEDKFGEGS
jgi:hypothetical protein